MKSIFISLVFNGRDSVCTGFHQVFTVFDSVLLRFTGFYLVLPGWLGAVVWGCQIVFTGFDRWNFTQYQSMESSSPFNRSNRSNLVLFFCSISLALNGHHWVSLDFTRFDCVLPGFTGFYRVLPGFTEFNWVLFWFLWFLPGFTGFYLVFLGFIRFYWVFLGLNRVMSGFTGCLIGCSRLE